MDGLQDYGEVERSGSHIRLRPVEVAGVVDGGHFTRLMSLGRVPLPREPTDAETLRALVGERMMDAMAEAQGELDGACARLGTYVNDLASDLRAEARQAAIRALSADGGRLASDERRARRQIRRDALRSRLNAIRGLERDLRARLRGERLQIEARRTCELRVAGDDFSVVSRVRVAGADLQNYMLSESLPQFMARVRTRIDHVSEEQDQAWHDAGERVGRAFARRLEDPHFDHGRLRSLIREAFGDGGLSPTRVVDRIMSAVLELDRLADDHRAGTITTDRPDLVVYKDLFPVARRLRRRLLLYIGPTNSGKTHRALDHLVEAGGGAYLAPLRLLALEGQERIQERGADASYLTGEERDIRPGAPFIASTIEMLDFSREVPAVVIDEAQLLADEDRGWAWTQALIGAPARTVIMTGSEDCEPLVRRIAEYTGEELEVRRLDRYTPLTVNERHTALRDVEPGTAIIAFSRRDVLALKAELEPHHGRVAVVYGNLTPEVRREEARRFRSGEAPVLVGTDSLGLGLNLPIRTVLFFRSEKWNGRAVVPLTHRQIRQIGGRAGRYGLHEAGFVGTIHDEDLRRVRDAFRSDREPDPLPPILQVRPHVEHVEALAGGVGSRSLERIMDMFRRRMTFDEPMLTAAVGDDLVALARIVDTRPEVPLQDRLRFAFAPVDPRQDRLVDAYRTWFVAYAVGRTVRVPSVPQRFLGHRIARDDRDLHAAEIESKVLTVYSWLSFRWPESFPDGPRCAELRSELDGFVERSLAAMAAGAGARGAR